MGPGLLLRHVGLTGPSPPLQGGGHDLQLLSAWLCRPPLLPQSKLGTTLVTCPLKQFGDDSRGPEFGQPLGKASLGRENPVCSGACLWLCGFLREELRALD